MIWVIVIIVQHSLGWCHIWMRLEKHVFERYFSTLYQGFAKCEQAIVLLYEIAAKVEYRLQIIMTLYINK